MQRVARLPHYNTPMPSEPTQRPVTRIADGHSTTEQDHLAVEEPVEIRIGRAALAITMRTPGDDEDLAAGFCYTEGLIADPADLLRVEPCINDDEGNIIVVTLSDAARMAHHDQIEKARRQVYMSSSCGVCGKQTLDRIETQCPTIRGHFTVTPEVIAQLPGIMRAAQPTFDTTGGLHAAALFDPEGNLRVLREDVGRHNAVDKVIGHAVRQGDVPIDPGILLVSGRSSFEIMQKAAMAGIAMVCAVSAPSSLAVDFAARLGITLVGFLRPGRMNVYHDRNRIKE